MQSASYIRQPKVNTSLQNPSALHPECIGGEAGIDHSDKHLTLQEHMRSLLKLLIALNTFSYPGRFVTNCSLVGRCRCPSVGDDLPSVVTGDSGVGGLAKSNQGLAEEAALAVVGSWAWLLFLTWPRYLRARAQVRRKASSSSVGPFIRGSGRSSGCLSNLGSRGWQRGLDTPKGTPLVNKSRLRATCHLFGGLMYYLTHSFVYRVPALYEIPRQENPISLGISGGLSMGTSATCWKQAAEGWMPRAAGLVKLALPAS